MNAASDFIEIRRDGVGVYYRCLWEGCQQDTRTFPGAARHVNTHLYEAAEAEEQAMGSGISKAVFDALVRDIEDGDWDDYLLPLAKACMERANTKKGGDTGDRPLPKKRLAKADVVVAQEHDKFMGAAIPSELMITPEHRIQPAPFGADKCIEVKGRSYRRQDLRGKHFRMRPGTLRGAKYDNVMVKITGAGEQKLQVLVPNTISDGIIDMKDGSSAIYLPYSRVEYLFG